MSTPIINSEYDIIIAGAGTSAGVLAARLAAASPALRILLLDAGPDILNNPAHTQPARFFHHLAPTSTSLRFHAAPPSAALGGRALVVPTGQCVGGSSAVNFSMYTRASRSDFDDWETEFGNPGWGSADLAPLLEKSEAYQAQPGAATHGAGGALKVSYGGCYTNVGRDFFAVAKAFDTVREAREDADPNDLDTINVYSRWPKWIDGKTGQRTDVAHALIYPSAVASNNITVVSAAHVLRVTFDGNNRATGVEFTWDPRLRPEADRDVHTVRAARLVVLAAGVFGSPGILERSGVGRADVLGRAGVQQHVDLPGVGEGYQDHNGVFVPYTAAPEAETLDGIARGEPDAMAHATEEWTTTGQGLMAHNSMDVGVKLRPTPAELDALGTPFRARWDAYYAPKPDKPLLWLGAFAVLLGDPRLAPPAKYFTMGYYTEHPLARGHVHITSATDATAPTDFRSGYLEDMADVTPLVWAYKFTRELARRMPLFRGEPPALHPHFAADSPACIIEHAEGPVSGGEERILYGEEDEAAVEAYVRQKVTTTWHSLGTCAMKPREDAGVVDSRLNVYGVSGVKIVDMSICPGNVAANTYSTALVVGEKAALIIAEELSITGV